VNEAGSVDRVLAVTRTLEQWIAARDWSGSDPYDALNATRFLPKLDSTLGLRLVTQAVKRSPINLRPALGIPHEVSAVTLAHGIASYARNGFLPAEEARLKLGRLTERLLGLRCTGFDEPCWGYHFDVHTRVFSYPRGAPNTIATAFAAMALLDAHEQTGDRGPLELASGAGDFFLRHVPMSEDRDGAFFGYLVGDRTPIHNANMLVAALLARLGTWLNRPELTVTASACVRYTLARQRIDGSWPYGERPHLEWVDNFHTGYVLDALLTCYRHGAARDALEAIDRGLAYYRDKLFRADGAPKYTSRNQFPIDIQCVAQGIQTFALATPRFPESEAWAWRVFDFAMREMLRGDGAFAFQRRRRWLNRTPHMRWAEAPMLLALVHLCQLAGGAVPREDGPAPRADLVHRSQ
jgi:hypothetical protein